MYMKFYSYSSLLFFIFFVLQISNICFAQDNKESKIDFSFGVIADCQYCNVVGSGERKYTLSPQKLSKCVNHFNDMDLGFVVHLGDFIDRDFSSFDVVGPIYKQLKMPKYHVLGNHDFSVSDNLKKDVPAKMGLSKKYYDFNLNGWRFIVLDGNDISFHAYPKNSNEHKIASEYYEKHQISSPKWNGAIGPDQINWLKSVLHNAEQKGESVVLFCHFPIFPENVHNLWNAPEIIEIINQYSCVKAYMNGHNHAGNYGIKEGVHYVTFKGMVDTKQNSYASVEVLKDQLQVTGFGREENRKLKIRKD